MLKAANSHRPQIQRGPITLVPISVIDEHILEVLKQSLKLTFERTIESSVKIWNLNYAYNPRRKQYSSARLLWRLRHIRKGADDKILGIVDVDLYSPQWEYIFGEAEINSGIATLSLFRLRPKHYDITSDAKLFERRVVKEAVHELGHLYQLGHCENSKCVMCFSTSLSAIDRKTKHFCSNCQQELKQTLNGGST
jgi:archaemetzincin